jgi:hypothetical protein
MSCCHDEGSTHAQVIGSFKLETGRFGAHRAAARALTNVEDETAGSRPVRIRAS